MRNYCLVLLFAFCVSPALAQSPQDQLKTLLKVSLTNASDSQTNVVKLKELLKSHPALANEPIKQLNGPNPSTPLVEALLLGNVEAAKLLLENGANPNTATGRRNRPPLLSAMSDLLDDEVKLEQVNLLLSHGADAKLSLGGWAARKMWKDQKSYYAAADALVAAKASVNAKDETGFSPLSIAVLNENTSAVKKLLELKATVDEAVMNSARSQIKVGTSEAGNIMQLLKSRSKI